MVIRFPSVTRFGNPLQNPRSGVVANCPQQRNLMLPFLSGLPMGVHSTR